MPEENKDANQEQSSSSELPQEQQGQQEETQTPPAQEGETPQDKQQEAEQAPFHKHPRFKELIEENKWLKQNMERMIQERQTRQALQQPTQDPYEGMSAEEEKFWRVVDARATKIAKEHLQSVSPLIEAGRQELAQIQLRQFRAEHPDIAPESPEEIAIARKIMQGYTPEDAYRSVMWDIKFNKVEEQDKQRKQQQLQAKKQANVEQNSIAKKSGLPPANEKLTLRQRLERNLSMIEQGKL